MTSERCNTYINDISCRSDSPVLVNNEKSEIAEFFAYTNVLITGGTGFLGKLIIEKLLRCVPLNHVLKILRILYSCTLLYYLRISHCMHLILRYNTKTKVL